MQNVRRDKNLDSLVALKEIRKITKELPTTVAPDQIACEKFCLNSKEWINPILFKEILQIKEKRRKTSHKYQGKEWNFFFYDEPQQIVGTKDERQQQKLSNKTLNFGPGLLSLP